MVVGEKQRKLGAKNLYTLHQGAIRLQQKLEIIVVIIAVTVVVGVMTTAVVVVRRVDVVAVVIAAATAAVLLGICECEARWML